MTIQLSQLRVSLDMDVSQYTAALREKAAADRAAGATSVDLAGKVAIAGDSLSRLRREFEPGAAATQKFERGMRQLSQAIEQGKIEAADAERLYGAMSAKLGLVGNSAELAGQGYLPLASVVDRVNGKLAAQASAADTATAAMKRLGAANDNVGRFRRQNLLFQAQDIGVSLAGGMNPLMVLAQQGSQIAGIYAGQGGVNAALADTAGILGTLATRFGPIALAAGAVALAIRDMQSEIERATGTAVGFGETAKAALGVVAGDIKALLEPAIDSVAPLIGEAWDQISTMALRLGNTIINSFHAAFTDVVFVWQQFPNIMQSIVNGAINAVVSGVESMLNGVTDTLNAWIDTLNERLTELIGPGSKIGRFDSIDLGADLPMDSLDDLKKAIQERNDLIDKIMKSDPLGDYYRSVRDRAAEVIRQNAATKKADEDREKGADFVRGQQERIENLRLEIALMGQSDDVRARLISQMEAEQQIRRMGIETNGAEAQAIRENAQAITEYTLELQHAKEAQDEINKRAQFFGDLTMGVIDDLTSGADGLEKALKRVVNALADAVLQAVLLGQGPLAGLFGTAPTGGATVGGLLGSLFGGGAPSTSPVGQPGNFMAMLTGDPWAGMRSVTTQGLGGGAAGLASGGTMSQWAAAIRMLESAGSGGYGALGPWTNGDRAYGAYQVMGNNIGPWSEKWWGTRLSASEFLSNPAAQDKIFAGQFGMYADKWGPGRAANAWFTGSPYGSGKDVLGTTNTQYVDKFNAALAKLENTTGEAAKGLGKVGIAGADATKGLSEAAGGLAKFGSNLGSFLSSAQGGGSSWFQGLMGSFGGMSGALNYMWDISPEVTNFILGGGVGLFADGAAFSGGRVIPFARGGVVGRPTLFPMAEGAGLMGEAGPEAVMPLRRGADGRLGVSMHGGGALPKVNFTVINNSSAVKVEQHQKAGNDGEIDLVAIISDIVADQGSRQGTAISKMLDRRGAKQGLKRLG